MAISKAHRLFWSALSFFFFSLAMLGSGLLALEYARSLRDGANHILTRIAPLTSALGDIDADFSSLRTSDLSLRAQAYSHPPLAELVPANVYLARTNDDLRRLAELDMEVKERVEFFAVRNAISRYVQQHSEYRTLLAAGSLDKATGFFDNLLFVSGADISNQISALSDAHRQRQARDLAAVGDAFASAFWAIAACIALALSACLLVAAWQLRRTWRRTLRGSLVEVVNEESGLASPSVHMLIEASSQLHAITHTVNGAQTREAPGSER